MAYIRKRGKKWQAEIDRAGQKTQTGTFSTKAETLRWVRLIEGEMDRGIFVSRKEAESTTLHDALGRYEKEVSILKKGHKQEAKRIRQWQAHKLASRHLANLRGADFAQYRDERLSSGTSGSTIRLDMALVSHLFTVAAKEWGMESLDNPVHKIRLPPPGKARDRRMTEQEWNDLLTALEKRSRSSFTVPAVKFAVETAMRQGEITGIRWEWVDLKGRVIYLPETKNGEARAVPLSSKAMAILAALPRSISGRVFAITGDGLSRSFAVAARNSGVPDVRFHDLRHEAASRLFEKGFNPMEAAAVTGHKTLQMLKRYTHLRPEDLAKKLG